MPKDYRALFGRRILVAPSRQLRAFQALAGGYAWLRTPCAAALQLENL